MISFSIERDIATISSTGSTRKALTLTSWADRPAKVDLRTWRQDESGAELPGKGLTLTDDEAAALAHALTAYLTEKGAGHGA
ncbi:MAG: transcriptional coactivator p15/PC4 family protein [Clostridiales bacterium]|nr:transcriptional coactivator p15/PC4 family protein [Clostridiales bacterium]